MKIMEDKFQKEYKSNNWLKSHGKPMRRKPFKGTSGFVVIGQGMSFSNKSDIIKNQSIANIVILDPKDELN